MEKTVKQRLMEFLYFKGISQSRFERLCGMSNGYINNLKKSLGAEKLQNILKAFPELNTEWLLYGEGEMLKSTPTVQQNNTYGDNNYNNGVMQLRCVECGGDVEVIEAEEARRPIIPTEWTYQPNVDLYEKVRADISKVSRSRFIALDVPIDMWHIVRDDSLLPDCKRGDFLGLNAYPIGEENPVPGKLHAVDTNSNGILIRKLFFEDYGYRGVAPNREYPDMRIEKVDVIRVYRIVCLARIAL